MDDTKRAEAFEDEYRLATTIAAGMKKHNMDVSVVANTEGLFPTYDLMLNTPEGPQKLDEEFWNAIGNSEYEITGAMGMAAGAARLGVALPGWGKVVSILGGAAVGASVGKAADLVKLSAATNELENLKASFVINRMIDAGVADLTFNILGTTVAKAATGSVKLVGKAYNYFAKGNLDGAYAALKTHLGVDDEQVKEIIRGWEHATGTKAPGIGLKEKATSVLPQVTPGGEDIVSQAAQLNPRVGAQVIKSISDRATNVIKAADNITTDNLGVVLHDDLGKYSSDVKNFYGGIKNHAVDAMENTGYQFDYDKLAIEPAFKAIGDKISNPAIKEQFLAKLDRVRH